MKFDLRQLQAFVTVAQTANYRVAAERLFITQPALTKQIQVLEQTLGCTLFHRGRHGAELTAVGRQLLVQAQALIEQASEFERYALALAKGLAGQLRIGLACRVCVGAVIGGAFLSSRHRMSWCICRICHRRCSRRCCSLASCNWALCAGHGALP